MESTQPTSELVNLQQLQEGLRSILAERNRLEILLTQTNLAMEELAKVSDGSTVFKAIGNILIPRTSESILAELGGPKDANSHPDPGYGNSRGPHETGLRRP